MSSFFATDFTQLDNFCLLSGILFGVIFVRYLIFSGLGHFWLQKVFRGRQLHNRPIEVVQIRKEIIYSAVTSLIFALSGSGMVVLWQLGHTKLYMEWSIYPFWYFPASILIFLFLHETYYYWLHRWMHLPGVYRFVHKVHHDSISTSAMTSFSFHPIESIFQAVIIPILLLFIPLHIYGLFALLLIMTLSGTINHLGFEMFPSWWNSNRFSKWIIGATHHDLHHKRFRFNFGLYFTFWDRWMDTESPEFDEAYEKVTANKQ